MKARHGIICAVFAELTRLFVGIIPSGSLYAAG
jgi:hypothetical protein